MPSVNQATQIFSILSDLVLAEYLAKHDACFPLNDDLQRVIAKAGLRYQIFLSRMRDYAGLDDALMELYTMVPWLSQQPIEEWNYFLSFNFLSDRRSDKKLSDKK